LIYLFQTLAFIKELGKFTDLKSCLISGGDNMDSQFEAMHGHPDIIVATPGRFVHLCVEMELKLSAIEIVVFDEADRCKCNKYSFLYFLINKNTLPKIISNFK